jgi:hypothetical protein
MMAETSCSNLPAAPIKKGERCEKVNVAFEKFPDSLLNYKRKFLRCSLSVPGRRN